jgi:hypothetical protein
MFISRPSPEEMDQLDQGFDLLNKREAMRLVELVSEKYEIPHLAVGLGVFLVPPRLYDPEAEGWRILIDQDLIQINAQRIEGLISCTDLRCETIYLHYGPFIEILQPRSRISCARPPPAG